MPNSNYSVSNYEMFDDAISVTNSLNAKLSNVNEKIISSMNYISDDTFKGPAADVAMENYNNIVGYLKKIAGNLGVINNYFANVSSNYREADNSASNVITGNDGKSGSNVITGNDGKSGSGSVGTSLSLGSSSTRSVSIVANLSQQEFIDSIKDGAIECYKKYHVLPSLTIAQAILESGWGKSAIGNNLFGIKAGSNWTGKTKTVRTSEYGSGGYYHINDTFRDYDSIDDSIEDHAKLLTNSRYDSVRAATNYKTACQEVQKDGYATSPTYANSLIKLIEQYNLDQWDNISV